MIFKKILLFAMFATAAGFCFADGNPCGTVPTMDIDGNVVQIPGCDPEVAARVATIPIWPNVDSAANAQITNTATGISNIHKNDDNIKIVSDIGADLQIENNIDLGTGRHEFSGGANMLHPYQAPAGFNVHEGQAEMPLLHQEMLEDDGGAVLSMSRSGRHTIYNNINLGGSGMVGMAGATGMAIANGIGGNMIDMDANGNMVTHMSGTACDAGGTCEMEGVGTFGDFNADAYEVEIDESATDESAPAGIQDQVRSWVVASGQTLRGVLQDWCNKEGWDLVWATPREYPIEASAVFKGRFVDVSSALVRNFGRATPVPYAKFYKGNRVLVVTADEGQ